VNQHLGQAVLSVAFTAKSPYSLLASTHNGIITVQQKWADFKSRILIIMVFIITFLFRKIPGPQRLQKLRITNRPAARQLWATGKTMTLGPHSAFLKERRYNLVTVYNSFILTKEKKGWKHNPKITLV
jgi:hypothetical protein